MLAAVSTAAVSLATSADHHCTRILALGGEEAVRGRHHGWPGEPGEWSKLSEESLICWSSGSLELLTRSFKRRGAWSTNGVGRQGPVDLQQSLHISSSQEWVREGGRWSRGGGGGGGHDQYHKTITLLTEAGADCSAAC